MHLWFVWSKRNCEMQLSFWYEYLIVKFKKSGLDKLCIFSAQSFHVYAPTFRLYWLRIASEVKTL